MPSEPARAAHRQVVPLLLAPTGGPVWSDRDLPAHRTLLTSRSVEFDAVVVAALLAPAGCPPEPRREGGCGATPAVDPRLTLLVDEAFRHGKAIGVLGTDADAAALGLSADRPGVVVGDPSAVAVGVIEGLSRHRAWDRFTPSR